MSEANHEHFVHVYRLIGQLAAAGPHPTAAELWVCSTERSFRLWLIS